MITLSANVQKAMDTSCGLVWLVQLLLDDSTRYFASEDVVISGAQYTGLQVLQDGLGDIETSINVLEGGNIGNIGNTELTLNNFSDINGQYLQYKPQQNGTELANRVVKIGCVYNAPSSSLVTGDIVWLYEGKIKDFNSNVSAINLSIQHDEETDNIEIPKTLINETLFPNAPKENLGLPLPIVYGDFYTPQTDAYKIITLEYMLFPCICVDSSTLRFIISGHPLHTLELNKVYYRVDGMRGYADLLIENPIGTTTFPITNTNNGGYAQFTIPKGSIFVRYQALPTQVAPSNSALSPERVLDKNYTNYATCLAPSNTVAAYLTTDLPNGKFTKTPTLGAFTINYEAVGTYFDLCYVTKNNPATLNTIGTVNPIVSPGLISQTFGGGSNFLDNFSNEELKEIQWVIYSVDFGGMNLKNFTIQFDIIIGGERIDIVYLPNKSQFKLKKKIISPYPPRT